MPFKIPGRSWTWWYTFNPNSWRAEAGRCLLNVSQLNLQSKFQASQAYKVRHCLKSINQAGSQLTNLSIQNIYLTTSKENRMILQPWKQLFYCFYLWSFSVMGCNPGPGNILSKSSTTKLQPILISAQGFFFFF